MSWNYVWNGVFGNDMMLNYYIVILYSVVLPLKNPKDLFPMPR